MVQLEHDGILSTRYHRGAYVERFDETVVREHHELYGMLNGLASARAAVDPTPRILAQLDAAMRTLRAAKDAGISGDRWGFRGMINDAYAGPRLQAAIRASQSFAPSDFWLSYLKSKPDFLPTYEDETAAIHQRDPEAARAVCVHRADLMATIMLGELVRRGVLGDLRSH